MKVFIIAAVTADGFIGRDASHSADWTSREDKKLFVKLTKEAGVMVMGSRTFDTIGRALPDRKTVVYTSRPEKYQIDGVEASGKAPAELVKQLEQEGFSAVAICGGASIYDLFLRSGVVDELYLTVEPILFGKGLNLLNAKIEQSLELLELDKLNENTVLAHYKLVK
jgi:dihydrofolate reductase